ncbi:MAG: pyridoxal phosphate-dependent aminotransferase [Acidobacteriaceae bacterium]
MDPVKPSNTNLLPEVSRRSFMRILGAASVGAATLPVMTESQLAWAQTSRRGAAWMDIPPGAVLINANENPLGPSPAARKAVAEMANMGGRYDFGATVKLGEAINREFGLKPGYLAIYAGSSEPLQFGTMAFTSPEKSLLIANPSYEAAPRAAADVGAKVHYVPLKADYTHDLKAMVATDPHAGMIYICNPNNPTGTVTKREDIVWALNNKPKGTILMVDEAYIHLSDAEPVIDLAAEGKDIVVLRTFSKIYGMAGLRCGFVVGRPDLLEKMRVYGMNPMPITGAAAARVSIMDKELVPTRKKIIADIRNDTFEWLAKNHYEFTSTSQSNCFMVNCHRPGKEVFAAMAKKGVYIGRTWPVWPNWVRVTVGSPEDMAKFKVAFKEVMDSHVKAAELVEPFADPLAHVPFSHLS